MTNSTTPGIDDTDPEDPDQTQDDVAGRSEVESTKLGSSQLGRELSLRSPSGLPEQIGPYKIIRAIGEGGMGTVCLVEQQEPIRRRAALKLIKGGQCSTEIVARFEAERQALAMMDHPNIAKILDGGQTDEGVPYFVMEYVDGIPLTEYCDQHRLTIRERLELFLPVCRAVHHAHQKGIIHRDLKPSNVLVAIHDGQPAPKVIDFGLAKAIDRTNIFGDSSLETEFGQLLGTIRYMSPEQADLRRVDIDTRTDIYSLGVMLYELLTGTTPLDQDTLKQEAKLRILELIRERDPPRPSARLNTDQESATSACLSRKTRTSKLQSLLRGELDWIVMKALEIERNRRYESASSFGEDVLRYLEDRAVLARPPSTWYRLQKLIRQHRAAAAIIAIVLGCLTALTVMSVNWAVEAREYAKNLEEAKNEAVEKASEAKVAATLATREREAQEVVTNIMLEVFDAGDPILGRLLSDYGSDFGQAPSIQSVVKQVAAEELKDHTRLAEYPEVRARLINSLGDICLSSGDVRFAKQVFEKSLKLLDEASVASGTDRDKAIMAIGTCEYLLGNLAKSKTLLHQFLDSSAESLTESAPVLETIRDRAFGTFVLAGVYIEEEDFDQSRALLKQVSLSSTEDSRDIPVLIDFARILSAIVLMYEMDVKGESNAQQWMEIIQAVMAGLGRFNSNDTLVGPFRGVLQAELLGVTGLASPYSSYVAMHDELSKATGEGHFLTLLSRFGMAVSAERFGDFPSAVKHYDNIIALTDQTLGRAHPRFAMILQRYAYLKFNHWMKNGRSDPAVIDSALALCTEALDIRRRALPRHRVAASSLYQLGRIQFEKGEFSQAIASFTESYEIRQSLLGDHEDVSRVLMWKAESEGEDGQFAAAVATAEQMLALDQRLLDGKSTSRSQAGSHQLVSARIQSRAAAEGGVTLDRDALATLLETSIANMQTNASKYRASILDAQHRLDKLQIRRD